MAAYRARPATATLISIVPGHVGSRRGDAIPVPRPGPHPRVRDAAARSSRCRSPAAARARPSSSRRRSCSRACSPASASSGTVSLPPRARPARQRRHAARPGPRPHLADPGCRRADRRSRSARSPRRTRPRTPRSAIRRARRSASTGSSGSSRPGSPGRPAARCSAGKRVLARSTPGRRADVTTTINPTIERAAITAMAGRYAGIAAMDPRTGGLLALAGVAFSALQPPGSTMKIITATGALEAGIVKLTDTFPIQDSANVDGFILQNANGEACGGTFLNAFAVSCNSVFAPLGVKLGASAAGRHRRALRLQPAALDSRRGREPDPVGRDDRRRHRRRLLGDRPGQGADAPRSR